MASEFTAQLSDARDELIERVVARLLERGETLSLAESCTGGLLSARLAARAGISAVYVGSVVAYSNAVKENLLGVPVSLLKSVGAVSLPVARRMSLGARAAFKTTWALSITGIAGPAGGSGQKPVGTVCFGMAGPGLEQAEAEQMFFEGSRTRVQAASAEHALRMLLRRISVEPSKG